MITDRWREKVIMMDRFRIYNLKTYKFIKTAQRLVGPNVKHRMDFISHRLLNLVEAQDKLWKLNFQAINK
jgi:hypothetical protein